MTEDQPPDLAQSVEAPLTLAYRDAPTGEVVASDAALHAALKKSRPWAQFFALALFLYAVVGLGLGTMWLVVLLIKRSTPSFPLWQFIVISTGNLLFAPIALVGGVLAMRFIAAAGRAYNRRSSEELDNALLAQSRIWRWAGVTVLAMLAFPFVILFVAALLDLWP